jgi:tetratricopeptide (TPR) repeat protein
MRFRQRPGPARQQNTREFLPAQANIKLVPVTAADAARAKARRIAMWGAVVLAVLVAAGIGVWRTSRPDTARAEYQDAQKLYASGKYGAAIGTLTYAIGQEPRLIEAYELRARAHRALGQMEEALADLNIVIAARPDFQSYRLRASTYRDLFRPAEALQDYTKAIEMRPTADEYKGRGICYRDLGQNQNAIQDFTKAIEQAPDEDGYLQRGMAYEAIGNHQAAIADLDKAIEYRPDVPYSYRARATAREALGDHAGAKADRAKAQALETPKPGQG